MIALEGRVTRGGFTAELALDVEPGELVGVVGENGAGKSTLLRVLSGLTPLDEGRLELGGVVVDDPEADVFVAPEDRSSGVVHQKPTLFPHLDLRDNVAFGLRRDGQSKAAARETAMGRLDQVGVRELARARPRQVSGGQAQRAAIARTLARDPDILLLDEPLAALDQDGRTLVRRLLRTAERRPDRAIVLVSHDPVDAFALADRLVVLEAGRVTQIDTPAAITRRPRSAFVARLVGLNLLEGRSAGTTVTLAGERDLVTATSAEGPVLVTATSAEGPVLVTVAPHAVALYRSRPDGSPRNTWSAPVDDLEAVGNRVRVALGGQVPLVAEITPGAVADLGLVAGDTVWLTVKATEVDVYPA